ncbi:MAG TPA: deoxyribodipyrimidine photo-lyase [Casimicrobiaceae bacterium]|nr:deoxyribodipyrimidine photo-lyase [Casimicrobiaceae bacterium]
MSARSIGRALVWFRRDLRDFDHAALYHALRDAREVYCAFVFDREILDPLPARADRRVEFIRESLVELDAALRSRGGALVVRHDHARTAIPQLAAALRVDAVYANHDYEPAACARDEAVAIELRRQGIALHTFKDQVIFERDEVLTRAGKPFSVFTPYKRAWLAALTPYAMKSYPVDRYADALAAADAGEFVNIVDKLPGVRFARGVPTLAEIGFRGADLAALGVQAGMSGAAARIRDFRKRIDRYCDARDFPAAKGPSYLSVHLRFGTASIREVAAWAHRRSLEPGGEGAATWLSELIWRDFFAQLLWHRPDIVDHAFKPEYDDLRFENDRAKFAAWREGRTGYPIVDAAMRQIDATGYMHNRLRMIAASFLVKDLLVDWRRGERYFADTLLDYELASNNGGWQWAASTGCDAQPYFRIFNPVTQSERFDPAGKFIRRYVPELAAVPDGQIHAPWRMSIADQRELGVVIGRDYPAPIVDHAKAREDALALFGAARPRGTRQRE